ncbi:transferrin-like [Condylostylus longicornis]|uniref:transferrin-like n=1 Tax=Condylostylus longicornis TaxID=2530218 RepID=UPI00244DF546|nr:transferrin-like [Condylostylus longicornis]
MFAAYKISLFFGVVVCLLAQQISADHVKMCVEKVSEQKKCETMAEKVKDFVKLECVTDAPCTEVVYNDKADYTVVNADAYTNVMDKLEPVLFEKFDDDNVVVAVVKADKENKVHELPLDFKESDLREVHGALYLNHYRHNGVCKKVKPAPGVDTIKIVRYHDVKDKNDKKLVCVENDKVVVKPMDEYMKCHVEANIPNAVMVKKGSDKKDVVVKMMKEVSEKQYDDFKLFGVFMNKYHDLIFSDEAKKFVKEHPAPNGVTVDKFVDLHCGDVDEHHNH